MLLAVLLLQAATAAGPAAGPAIPAANSPQAHAAANASAQGGNERICKAESITGSRLGGFKVCMTKAEWDAKSAQGRDTAAGWQSQGYTQIPR